MTPATAIITGTLSKARERTSRKNIITQHECSWMCVMLKHLPGRVSLCGDVHVRVGACVGPETSDPLEPELPIAESHPA